MKISIYAAYAKERLEQRVNIQFCILNESSSTRKLNDPVADYSSLVAYRLPIPGENSQVTT
jgi:hypothetical protein